MLTTATLGPVAAPSSRWRRRRWQPRHVPARHLAVGRAILNEDPDLTLFEHEGQVELLWIDMAVEDAKSFPFGSVDEAKAFAADRCGVGTEDWT